MLLRAILSSLFFFLLIIPGKLIAQNLIIERGTILYDDAPRSCIRVEMEPLPKEVKKAWDDYVKDNFDIKMKGIGFLSNKDILSAEEVSFSEISNQKLNLYTRVIEQGISTEMCVFARLDNGKYLNEEDYALEFGRLENIVESFVGSYLPDHYRNLVEQTQEELEDMMDNRQDLSDDISDNRKEIAKLEKENREKSAELFEAEEKIKDLNRILQARKDKLQMIDRKLVGKKKN